MAASHCDLNFARTSYFQQQPPEANAAATNNAQFDELMAGLSVSNGHVATKRFSDSAHKTVQSSGCCKLDPMKRRSDEKSKRRSAEESGSPYLHIEDIIKDRKYDAEKNSVQRKMWDVVRSCLREKSAFVEKITVDQSCEQHSPRFGKEFKLKAINEMKSSDWHTSAVDGLLKFLVSSRTDFSLVAVCEDGPSDTYDHNLFLEFRFHWEGTGFACSVLENDFNFTKNLVLFNAVPKKKNYYLTSEKRPDLCVVMDGDKILLEGMKPDSFITIWSYSGNENDHRSRHHNSPYPLTVFGFKLNDKNSDVARCLGAANKTTVGLMDASIPDHGNVIPTKTDNRFFYHSTTIHGFSTFESTQFENHYLAVDDSEDRPCLYLKEITQDLQFHTEILFKRTAKHD